MAIALYSRKSVERENSVSCATQLEYCRSMLKPDEKEEKIYTFVDNGFSGGNTNRTDFQRMMQMIRKGKLKKVIVYRLDRISRSLSDFVGILQTFKEYNVQFVSSQETFDTSSPYGEMIVKILMVFAEFERQSIIERVKQAYDHRSKMGLYMGGRRPYGFIATDTIVHGIKTKMFVPQSEEAEQIKYLFETYAFENISLRRLMDSLIEKGILPTAGNWSTAKVSAILKNPIYVRADNAVFEYFKQQNTCIVSDIKEFDGVHGLQIYGKSTHDFNGDWSDIKAVVMRHEGLVSSQTWLLCQKKLKQNKQIGKAMSNTTSWLGGKIVCEKCGRTMTVTKGGRRLDGTQTRYFHCTGKFHSRICQGPDVTLYAESLENMADKLISDKLLHLKRCRIHLSTDDTNKINLLKNHLSEIKAAQDRLVSMMLNKETGREMMQLMNEKAQELAGEKTIIQKKIVYLENRESEHISGIELSRQWADATAEQKRAAVSILIHKILIREDGTVEVMWTI